jgi:putative peptidoglycan lipid II flippase
LDYVLMQWLGHTGIALATSVVALTNVAWLLAVLRRRLGGVDGGAVLATAWRTGLAGVVLALVSLGTLKAVARIVEPGFGGAALGLLAALAAGAAAYLGTCRVLGVRELALLRSFTRLGGASPGRDGQRHGS